MPHHAPWKTFIPALLALCLVGTPVGPQAASADAPFSLALLADLAGLQTDTATMFPLENFQTGFNEAVHAANMEYLKTNTDLFDKIRADIGRLPLSWRLESLSHRLLYAPEQRERYVALYETYCRQIISDVLAATGHESPYNNIVTLSGRLPTPENTDGGVTAFIVHDLAREYNARYAFEGSSGRQVAIELTGRLPVGEVGAYSSFLHMAPDGSISFTRDRVTIWQNNAANPYTALMTPVEETLHILLRGSTETAIRTSLERQNPTDPPEAATIVAEWIAVEEAVVGGLVYHLLPGILEKHLAFDTNPYAAEDLFTKRHFGQYKFLELGIALVGKLGYRKAIELYEKDPVAFRCRL